MQEITKSQIKNLLMEIIDKKLASYRPAVNYMPFLEAVFEKELVISCMIQFYFYLKKYISRNSFPTLPSAAASTKSSCQRQWERATTFRENWILGRCLGDRG